MSSRPSGSDQTLPGPAVVPGTPPPEGADLPAGATVGEYRIDKVIGRGGMGTVYTAQHPVIGKRVAVKVLATHLSSDPAVVQRFVDEARAVNKIGHPNIIDIFSFGRLDDGRQFFVMELLDGETLAARIERGPIAAPELKRLLGQACAALAAAHQEKIVHRDLKPENLWIVTPKHAEPFLKVLDFGIAKLVESTERMQVTQTGVVMGTPYFMSPEQCLGRGVDHRTDIYALGVLLYRMFAGRFPFEGSTFAEVIAQQITAEPTPPSRISPLPRPLERLILSCLEKNPEKRPQSAAALGASLSEALSDIRTTTQAAIRPGSRETRPGYESTTGQAKAILSGGRTRLALVAAALLAAVVAVALVVALRRPPRQTAQDAVSPAPPAQVAPALPPQPPGQPQAAAAPVAPVLPSVPHAPPRQPPELRRTRVLAKPSKGVVPKDAPDKTPRRPRVDDKGLVTDNPFK